MSKEVINVDLYGGKGLFGGREKPLEASVISCDKYKECSFYKNGHCLSVRRAFSSSCKFGQVSNIKGYTRRAKKYFEFKNKWAGHEQYNKLEHPPTKLGLIGDLVVFPYSYVHIEEDEQGKLWIKQPLFSKQIFYIEYSKFTAEFIYQLCTFKPQAMMGGTIESYQKEVVPLFLAHLEEVLPDKYQEFISKYDGFSEKIDYVGRKAKLKTIKPSLVHYRSDQYPSLNEEWYWDGFELAYQKGRVSKFNVTSEYEVVEIRIKPSDESVITITDNDQVTANTVFVD